MTAVTHLRRSWVGAFVVLSACGPLAVQPPSVVVEARISGVDGNHQPIPDAVADLRHGTPGGPRTVYRRDLPVQHIESARLAATASTGLPFAEEWHLLQLSREGQRPGADPVLAEHTGDRGWVRSHTGDLTWVTLRKNDLSLPSDQFDAFPPVSLRPAGALVLTRVEDDDPVLPWTATDCAATTQMPLSATLRPVGTADGVDCFDLESLSSLLLDQLAVVVSHAARERSARARTHALSVVPFVPTPGGPSGPDAPGIGFVYRTTLEPVAGDSGLAPFTGTLTLSVPITLVFTRLNGVVRTTLDPIGTALPGAPVLVNAARVTVTAVDGSISDAFAGSLLAGVTAAVQTTALPTGPAGIPMLGFLDLLFGLTVLGGNVPADFSVVALPADRTVAGAPDTTALRMGEIASSTRTVDPGRPGGRGARRVFVGGDGRVRISENLNREGTRVRDSTLPLVQEALPFDLVAQR